MLPSRSWPPSVGVKPTNQRPGSAGSPSVFVGRPRGVKHVEVPDELVEPGAEAGRGDDRVGRDARAVGEQDVGAVEAFDRGDDLDASAPHGVDDADVEDRRRAGRDERACGCRARAAAVPAPRDRGSRACAASSRSGRPSAAAHAGSPCRSAARGCRRRAAHDLRRRAHARAANASRRRRSRRARSPRPSCPRRRRARRGRGTARGCGTATSGQLAGEAVAARPVGNERRAVVARRDDHVLGADRPCVGLECQASPSRLDARRPACRCARRGRDARRSRGSTRSGRRARPSGRSGAGCAGRAGRRAGAACAGAAGRSAAATRRPAPGRPRARAGRSPCSLQERRGREPGRAGADDHDLARFHAGVLPGATESRLSLVDDPMACDEA